MTEEIPVVPVKRGRGRPRKNPVIEREPIRETKYKMRAKPNWEDMGDFEEETPDRLRIDPKLIPDGMSLQWVTETVYGQPVPQRRALFEKRGWTPVHSEDFDGRFDGMFTPKGSQGEINMEGLVLMARPKTMTEKAKLADKQRAREQVFIKEQALRGGDMPVSLDAQHPTAVRSNKINKTIERIEIPE